MRFTRLILALTSFLILITQTDLFASTVLHKTSMVDLSNNAIICMHQDPDGYLWIGTYDGLNLYNGKDTYVYRFELNNKNSLCSNIIHKISDAEPGFLWISTSLGINKFSLKERKVTESYPGYMESDLVATDSSGITLAICKENRISCYTPFSDGFRDLPREGIGPQTVRTLFAGTDGYFYLLLTSGILKKLTPDFSNTTFNLLSEERQFHNKPILSAFHENNHIFIVDTDNKLYRQQVDGSGKEFLFDLSGMTNKYGNIIKICTFQSNVYIVFRNGNILDLSQPENTINMGIGIFCLINDKRQEILWLGTDGQGIRMFYDKPDLFGSILLKDLPINIQNPIRSLYTDNDRSLWFGTKGDGIVRIQAYDTYPNKKAIPQSAITHFTTADGLSSNRVYSFQRSEFHPCIWIGTEGPGLCYYSYKENRMKTIPQQEDTPPIRYIHSICEVNDSTLWLATTGNGLLKVTLRMDKVTPTISKIQTFPLKNGEIAIYRIHYQILKKQKQIADKIKEEQKEKLYESKLNFFTHITHELCTPLTLINGVENYIQAYAATSKDKTLEKYTSVLRENVEELNGLIQEILDFRKAEDAGFSHTHIRRVSVSSLLRTQFEWFYPLSEQHQIQFKIDAPKELYWNTDSVYFKKILANLISNAFKYTEDGGTVRISLHEEENFLVLKVYNTGKGIEEADMQNIFDRYRILGTMDNDDNRQNTARNGLGLFICHSLVQSLGGKIDIESEVGQYAEFTVTLPFGIVEETSDNTIDEEIPVSLPSPNTDIQKPQISHTAQKETEDKPMILVIDDHKDIVWLITETLSSEYQVQEAYNAEKALEFLKQYTPSLIITDIMMPNIDGLELISLIKENRYTRHIPLIIVSAKISDQEQAAGLNIGADAYLTKPFSPTVLLSVVNRLMTNQRELKEYFYSPESAYQYTEGQLLHQEDKEFLDAVTAIIKENVSKEGLGPELVADALNINTRILYRRFKKISTMTPSDFIKDYRLNYAAQLLVNTNMSVQEIIYNVGISNKSYFYREFARKYNMTPKEYRTKEA